MCHYRFKYNEVDTVLCHCDLQIQIGHSAIMLYCVMGFFCSVGSSRLAEITFKHLRGENKYYYFYWNGSYGPCIQSGLGWVSACESLRFLIWMLNEEKKTLLQRSLTIWTVNTSSNNYDRSIVLELKKTTRYEITDWIEATKKWQ